MKKYEYCSDPLTRPAMAESHDKTDPEDLKKEVRQDLEQPQSGVPGQSTGTRWEWGWNVSYYLVLPPCRETPGLLSCFTSYPAASLPKPEATSIILNLSGSVRSYMVQREHCFFHSSDDRPSRRMRRCTNMVELLTPEGLVAHHKVCCQAGMNGQYPDDVTNLYVLHYGL